MSEVTMVCFTPNPVMMMAVAASVCYDSTPSPSLVKHCIESGHESILEFADFHFMVKGSRVFTHQLVRKRIGASFAQRSQRYCDESNFGYTIPPTIQRNPKALKIYEDTMQLLDERYKALQLSLTEEGLTKEAANQDARFVTPQAIDSVIHVKMTYRALRDFCKQRLCSRAQWEIREVAEKMKALVTDVNPMLGEYLVPKCMELGYCPEKKGGCGRMPKKSLIIKGGK